MSKRTWTITVVLIIIGLVLVAIYGNYKAKNIEITNNQREEAIENTINKSETTINVKHQYKDGEHVYVGTFETPTPCYNYNVELSEVDDNRVIDITYNLTENDQICAQVITEREFRISYEGDENDSVIATINGELVNLNVFEVPTEENINQFEIFIKG